MNRRGTLRASDADRDQIVDRLHRAATEGRIAAEELEQRVSVALKALTYSELEATVADLPGPRARGARGSQVQRSRSTGSWALATVRANPALLLLAIPVLAVTAALLLAATVMWTILMVVVMILGGRRHFGAPPWVHARRYRGRRAAGRYWA